MILAGFALVFSRLIDNAVIVLENIFRHLEMGEPPEVAAEKGGEEVSMAVLAATLTSSIVFFPVTFLYGVSRFLFSALALAVVLALFASYFVALTVVPLFCARFMRLNGQEQAGTTRWAGRRGHGGSRPRIRTTLQSRIRRPFRTAAGLVRAAGEVIAAASWPGRPCHHIDVRRQPDAVSVPRRRLLPADRRGPVRDERQGAVGQPPRGDDGRSAADRIARPAHRRRPRSRHHRLEHRRAARLLVALHQQFGTAHRHGAGRAPRGPPCRQLRIHVADARSHAAGDAAPDGLLSVGRHGGRRAEPGPAGADRRPAERVEPRRRVPGGGRHCRIHPEAARRERRLHPAGHRLPVAQARHRPRARRLAGPQSARGRQQRHHGADLQPDDRAELLGRSEERQRLHADRAVPGEPGPQPARPARHPAARRAREGSDAARRGHDGHADHVADRNRSLPDPACDRHLREPRGRRPRLAGERHSTGARATRRCRPASGSTCAGWCRACSSRSRASPSA